MTTQQDSVRNTAPGWSGLLLLAYIAHLAEEWWGGPGFSAWVDVVLGAQVSPERFIVINALALPIFTIGTALAIRYSRFAWFVASFSALLFLNGVLHLLATVGFATYSPGTVTSAILYLPLGGLVLFHMSRSLPSHVYSRAVIAGIVAHALVAVLAFI